MIRLFLTVLLLFSFQSLSLADEVDKQKVNAAIHKAYTQVMNTYFLELSKLAMKNKKAKNFAAAAMGVPLNSEMIKSIPSDEATPKITLITNGFQMTLPSGQVVKLTLAKKMGEVEIEGREHLKGKNASWRRKLQNIVSHFHPLPMAEAGVWDWLVGKGFIRVIDAYWPTDMYQAAIPISERMLMATKGSAVLAAEGAVIGCGVGMHIEFGDSKLDQCLGLALLASAHMTLGSNLYIAGMASVFRGYEAIKALPAAKQLLLINTAKYVSAAGVTAAIAHGADSLLKSDGVQLRCGYEGAFDMYDYSLTEAEPKRLYSSYGLNLDMAGNKIKSDLVGVKSFLKTRKNYADLDDQSLELVANQILAEIKALMSAAKNLARATLKYFVLKEIKKL